MGPDGARHASTMTGAILPEPRMVRQTDLQLGVCHRLAQPRLRHGNDVVRLKLHGVGAKRMQFISEAANILGDDADRSAPLLGVVQDRSVRPRTPVPARAAAPGRSPGPGFVSTSPASWRSS